MIKNVLPSLRQRAGPQRICSRQKSIRSGTARDSFSQAPHMRGKVIVDLVLTERHIAHRQIIEITAVGGLKASHGNVSLRIQHLGNAPGNAVQLHAVQAAICHGVRQHSEEVAHAHGRLQDVAAAETHALHGIVDTTDNGGAGVVGIQHGAAGGSVLILGEQPFQLRILFRPTIFAGVKGI